MLLDENIYHGVIKGAYFYAVGSKADFLTAADSMERLLSKECLEPTCETRVGGCKTLFEIKQISAKLRGNSFAQRQPTATGNPPAATFMHDAFEFPMLSQSSSDGTVTSACFEYHL